MKNNKEHQISLKSVFRYPTQPEIVTTITTDAVCLDEILDTMSAFLRGSGFAFDGELIVADTEEDKQDTVTKHGYLEQEYIIEALTGMEPSKVRQWWRETNA